MKIHRMVPASRKTFERVKTMRFLILLWVVVLSLWASELYAGCRVRYAAPVQEVAVVAPVVVASYLAVPVVVPAYSVGYAAGAVSYNAQEAVGADTQLPAVKSPCEDQLAELKARLATLEAKTGVQVTAKATEASVIVSRCAACHDASVAKTKGKGFILTEKGKELPLTNEARLKCIEKVVAGEMPKDGTLTDEEVTTLITQLSRATTATPTPAGATK